MYILWCLSPAFISLSPMSIHDRPHELLLMPFLPEYAMLHVAMVTKWSLIVYILIKMGSPWVLENLLLLGRSLPLFLPAFVGPTSLKHPGASGIVNGRDIDNIGLQIALDQRDQESLTSVVLTRRSSVSPRAFILRTIIWYLSVNFCGNRT